MELDLVARVPLEDASKIDEVLHRSRVDVGHAREVEDDGAEDGLGGFDLCRGELAFDFGHGLSPATRSRVCSAGKPVNGARRRGREKDLPFQGRSPGLVSVKS